MTKTLVFARNLRAIRKKAGYTQKQLADYIGITQVCIAQYETGNKTPSLATADKITNLFGVTMDAICYGNIGESNNVKNTANR